MFHIFPSASAEFLAYVTNPIAGVAITAWVAYMLSLLPQFIVGFLPGIDE